MSKSKKFNFNKALATADKFFFIPLYVFLIITVIIGYNVNENHVLYIEKVSVVPFVEILAFNAFLAVNFVFKFGGLYSLICLTFNYKDYIEENFLISKRNCYILLARFLSWGLWLSITSLYCVGEIFPHLNIKFGNTFTVEFVGLALLCLAVFYGIKLFVADGYKWYEKESFIYKDENTLSGYIDTYVIDGEKMELTEFIVTARYLYTNDDALVARYRK